MSAERIELMVASSGVKRVRFGAWAFARMEEARTTDAVSVRQSVKMSQS
jgi:hypothetical protein